MAAPNRSPATSWTHVRGSSSMIPVIADFATVVGLGKPALQIPLQAAQGSVCPMLFSERAATHLAMLYALSVSRLLSVG